MSEDKPTGCGRIEYHLRPINRQREGQPVMDWKRWIGLVVGGILVALIGGTAGAIFTDQVRGAVMSSEITTLRAEAVIARTERKEASQDRAALRQEVATTMNAVLVSIGELRGEITGLAHAVNRLGRR